MEEIKQKTEKISDQMDEEGPEPTAQDIKNSMMKLASKLSKGNLLKAYREKVLEAMEKGELNEDDDEMVNSEDFMVDEEEEGNGEGPVLPGGIDIGSIMKNMMGAMGNGLPKDENAQEGEQDADKESQNNGANPMDLIKNLMAGVTGAMQQGMQNTEEVEEDQENGIEDMVDDESDNFSDGLNSEERAELEKMQAEGFNPMEKFNSLLAGLNGAPVAQEGQEKEIISKIIEENGEGTLHQGENGQKQKAEEVPKYSITQVVLDYGDKNMSSKSLEELNSMLGADTDDDKLLAIFSLLKKVENPHDQELREKIFNLSNFKNIVPILENRDDFGLYTVKFLHFLVGKGDNGPFREKFMSLFKTAIFSAFGSFDTTQVTFALDLITRCLLIPLEGIQLNPALHLEDQYLIDLLFNIGQIDATKCTEPLKVYAIQYRAYNQVLQLIETKFYPLFSENWLVLSLKVMDIGNVYNFRFQGFQKWLGEHSLVLTTILGSKRLREVIYSQTKKVNGLIYMLLHIWQKSSESGRGSQLFNLIPRLREDVAWRDIQAIPDSSM